MKYLFVCKLSRTRSRAAAWYFVKLLGELKKKDINTAVKTAGTSDCAKTKLTKEMVEEADVIFAIDKPVYHRIIQEYSPPSDKKLVNLDIIDVYDYDGRVFEGFLEGSSLQNLCEENQENVLERPEIKERLVFDDILKTKRPILEKMINQIDILSINGS